MTSTIIEMETCGRCGGSGSYSYNQIDGSRCYGCNGRGERMTKRGAFINEVLASSREIPAAKVTPGMVTEQFVMTLGGRTTGRMNMYVLSVTEPKVIGQGRSGNGPTVDIVNLYLIVRAKSGYELQAGHAPDQMVKCVVTLESAEQRREFVNKAMALVTKAGKVAKGKDAEWQALCDNLRANTKPRIYPSFESWAGVSANSAT